MLEGMLGGKTTFHLQGTETGAHSLAGISSSRPQSQHTTEDAFAPSPWGDSPPTLRGRGYADGSANNRQVEVSEQEDFGDNRLTMVSVMKRHQRDFNRICESYSRYSGGLDRRGYMLSLQVRPDTRGWIYMLNLEYISHSLFYTTVCWYSNTLVFSLRQLTSLFLSPSLSLSLSPSPYLSL